MIEKGLNNLFKQFSPRVETIFGLAETKARRLGHTVLSPEHIFLGMIEEGKSPAVEMLLLLGVDLNVLREEIEEVSPPKPPLNEKAVLLVSYKMSKVLQYSALEAGKMDLPHLGSEPLLFNLVAFSEGQLAGILEKHNITWDRVHSGYQMWKNRPQ